MLLVGEDTEDISVGHAYFFVGWKKGRKPLPNCCSTCIFRQLFKQHLAMFMLHRTMHVVLVTRPHGEDKNATNTNLVGSSNKGVIQQAYSSYQESSKDVFVVCCLPLLYPSSIAGKGPGERSRRCRRRQG